MPGGVSILGSASPPPLCRGYGIRYRYGMFKQAVKDGVQVGGAWSGRSNAWALLVMKSQRTAGAPDEHREAALLQHFIICHSRAGCCGAKRTCAAPACSGTAHSLWHPSSSLTVVFVTPPLLQVELPDYWLDNGNPWEIRRPATQFK